MFILERFEWLQYFQGRKRREVEEIDLAGGESRVLEMAGRTKIRRINFFFTGGEIYEKRDKQEGKKKSHIKWLFIFFDHSEKILEKGHEEVNLLNSWVF